MALFQHHPPETRKKIALGITIGVGVILLILMILIYASKKGTSDNESGSILSNFYNTILIKGQSYVGDK
ncbi:MAG: hypothetical protein KBB91_01595 [Candidatus Pacebacteria bacterium]|nr:hypothetical protein [Candidatus Paceibacterota bacterium]MBP9700884.1 hypothetical protein [Candidatus Paceibacterota bacterium]